MEVIKYQLGIVEPNTSSAMFMMFDIKNNDMLEFGLKILQRFIDGKNIVAGFGKNLMTHFPAVDNYRVANFKSELIDDCSGYDLVLWIKDEDKGVIFHQALAIKSALADFFDLKNTVSSYGYRKKFDLSGFEDGIENPVGDEIESVAVVSGGDLNGSSFWVLQQWLHDFNWLNNNSQSAKEECIGRSLDDSHQFENLKDFAHVKRSAKENFTPEAELLRKSMPWSDDNLNAGLMFSCFASSFRSFNLQMENMLGGPDKTIDGIFKFSRILTTNYLWCPPFNRGRLDISLFQK